MFQVFMLSGSAVSMLIVILVVVSIMYFTGVFDSPTTTPTTPPAMTKYWYSLRNVAYTGPDFGKPVKLSLDACMNKAFAANKRIFNFKTQKAGDTVGMCTLKADKSGTAVQSTNSMVYSQDKFVTGAAPTQWQTIPGMLMVGSVLGEYAHNNTNDYSICKTKCHENPECAWFEVRGPVCVTKSVIPPLECGADEKRPNDGTVKKKCADGMDKLSTIYVHPDRDLKKEGVEKVKQSLLEMEKAMECNTWCSIAKFFDNPFVQLVSVLLTFLTVGLPFTGATKLATAALISIQAAEIGASFGLPLAANTVHQNNMKKVRLESIAQGKVYSNEPAIVKFLRTWVGKGGDWAESCQLMFGPTWSDGNWVTSDEAMDKKLCNGLKKNASYNFCSRGNPGRAQTKLNNVYDGLAESPRNYSPTYTNFMKWSYGNKIGIAAKTSGEYGKYPGWTHTWDKAYAAKHGIHPDDETAIIRGRCKWMAEFIGDGVLGDDKGRKSIPPAFIGMQEKRPDGKPLFSEQERLAMLTSLAKTP